MDKHDNDGVTGGQSTPARFVSRPFPNKNASAAALPLLKAKLAESPRDLVLLKAVATACAQAGHWDESLLLARRALGLGQDPEAFEMLVDSLLRLGRRNDINALLPEMIASGRHYTRGIASLHLLKAGRYREGFALRHEDAHLHNTREHPVCRDNSLAWWDGKAFDGKVLVVTEQALGEEILLSSVFGDLVARGQRAVVEADPRLIPLYARSFPGLEFVPRIPGALLAAAQPGCKKTTSSELGCLLRSDDNFHHTGGWLMADAGQTTAFQNEYRARWPGACLIGLSWRSFRPVWGDRLKSVRLAGLREILQTPNTAFINVQYGSVARDIDEARALNLPAPWIDPRIDTMMDLDLLAAQLSALDLVITTSNTTAHLAGALGVPCWVMLPWRSAVFWYWGYMGTRSPWYPSITFWRSKRDGDWQELDGRIRHALEDLPKRNPLT